MIVTASIDSFLITAVVFIVVGVIRRLINRLEERESEESVTFKPADYDNHRDKILRRQTELLYQEDVAVPISRNEEEFRGGRKPDIPFAREVLNESSEAILSNSEPPPLPKREAKKPLVVKPSLSNKKSTSRKRLLKMLSSSAAAKDAILLQEVLGPPKGMR